MFQFSLPVLGQRGVRQTFTFGLCIAPLFAGVALAQQSHDMSTMATPKAAPADLVKDAAPLQFESVLSRYKPMTDPKLTALTSDIATMQGRLRNAHLQTHLRQTAMLQPDQVVAYQSLRGS